ncbi:hypothetical protein ES705_17585 [subsurface metagenome]|jgi:hypothetical protein
MGKPGTKYILLKDCPDTLHRRFKMVAAQRGATLRETMLSVMAATVEKELQVETVTRT